MRHKPSSVSENPKSETQREGLASQPCSAFFGDVPLKIAMIAWTPRCNPGEGVAGRIIVIPQPLDCADWFLHFGVTNSTGACRSEWRKYMAKEQLLMLYIEAWHIVARDGVTPEDMHAALMVIPEYRDSLSGEAFFSWTNAEVCQLSDQNRP